jgi:hypothetical protein
MGSVSVLAGVNQNEKVEFKKRNKALGILNACEKNYEEENQTFFSGLTSSQRTTYTGVKQNFALCDQQLSNISPVEANELALTVEEIQGKIAPITILSDLTADSLTNTLRALLYAQVNYHHPINKEQLLADMAKSFPEIHKNRQMQTIFKNEVTRFSNLQQKKVINKVNTNVIRKELNRSGIILNKECASIREQYLKDKNTETLQKPYYTFSKSGTLYPGKVEDPKKAEPYFTKFQKKLNKSVDQFRRNNRHSQLLVSPSLKKGFTFNASTAKNCAKGITKNILKPITENSQRLITGAQKEYLALLKKELQKRNSETALVNNFDNNDNDDLDKIDATLKQNLKYRPHLFGNLLEKNKEDPSYQNIIAKYVCKYTNEIYNNEDEFWSATELALAGATIVGAVAAAFIPGIGIAISGSLLATLGTGAIGASVVATEVYIAQNRISDSDKTQNGLDSAALLNNLSVEYQTTEQERIINNRNWAYFDTTMALTGSAAIIKTLKYSKKVEKLTDKPKTKNTEPIPEPPPKDVNLLLRKSILEQKRNFEEFYPLFENAKLNGLLDNNFTLQTKNNDFMEAYQKILEEMGVKTELIISEKFPGYTNIELISTHRNAPKMFKIALKAKDHFDGNKIKISIIDNININSAGNFMSQTRNVDIGYDSLLDDVFKGSTNLTPKHELRHLLNNKKQREGLDEFFSIKFNGSKEINLYGSTKKDLPYGNYMIVDELYTHGSDLWEMAKKGKDHLKVHIEEFKTRLNLLKEISKNTHNMGTHLLKNFEHLKISRINNNRVHIVDQQKRSIELNLSNSSLKRIEESANTIPSHIKKLVHSILSDNKIDHLDFGEEMTELYNKLHMKSISGEITSLEKGQMNAINDISKLLNGGRKTRYDHALNQEIQNQISEMSTFALAQNKQTILLQKSLKDSKDIPDDNFIRQVVNLGQNTRWLYQN